METSVTALLPPASLLEGVDEAVCEALGIRRLRHLSALLSLRIPPGADLASIVHRTVAANWEAARAGDNKERSQQNWRWCLQPQIGAANRSPEVVLERAVATACGRACRDDWANQIPVASGLIDGARDGRRAIDLAARCADGHYELIELKVGSDTPLYAAVELLGYASVWLLSRSDPPARRPLLLDAEQIDLRVLAPAAFYRRFDLRALERTVDSGVRALGEPAGARLSFAFDVLPEVLESSPLPADTPLMEALSARRPLHG